MKSKVNKTEISSYIYILILLIFLLTGIAKGQSFLKNEISIVEFNTSWNENNHFNGFEKLKNCQTEKVSLCDNPHFIDKYNIIQPSIIVFHNGSEVQRFKSNIMMEFVINHKPLQSVVDSLILLKFN